jgi:KUP system potassium uptake protein
VYLSGHPEGMPLALLHNLKHNKVLHETTGILTIVTETAPRVPSSRRVEVQPLGNGLYRITARYGFMERASVPRILEQCETLGVSFPREETTFFLGRETLEIGRGRTLARWRKVLFAWMSRNAHDASVHFGVPPDRVVEIGVQLEI